MSARNLALLAAGASLAISVAACDSDTDTARVTPTATSATATPAASPATSAPAASPATSPPAAGPATSVPADSPAGLAGGAAKPSCPVTEAELQAAVKRKWKGEKSLTPESDLVKIVCYQNYAIATEPESVSDEQYVIFKYVSGSWSLKGYSSADICDGGVPADVIKRFRRAHYGACS